MSETQDEEVLGRAYDGRLMRRLLGYVRPYRRDAGLSIALIIASSLFQLAGPALTAIALDLYIRPLPAENASRLSRTAGTAIEAVIPGLSRSAGLNVLAIAFLASLVAGFAVWYSQTVVMNVMGQRIMFDLRQEIFAKLQRLHIRFFDRNPVGRLMTRVSTDVDALNEMFTAGMVSIFGDIVMLGGILLVLFWFDWRLASVTFAVIPLIALLTVWFKVGARDTFRAVRVRIAAINAGLQETLTGMSTVQLFNHEEKSRHHFDSINAAHRDANVAGIFYYAVYYPAVEWLSTLGVGMIVWYGGGQVIQGALSLGALVAFIQYAKRFYDPIADLSEKYNILQSAMASSERIFELLDTQEEILPPPRPFVPRRVAGKIEFEAVSFAYNGKDGGEDWVLRDVSFCVHPGETVAIVGATGAGKSTIASLLLRFYDVQHGTIAIDGTDIRTWDLGALRRAAGIVLQDVFLFSGTIAGNIRLGDESISRERVEAAAREVHADRFIRALPRGYDEPVRERGAGLSVGQKQLLAFARALAFDPRILILDEATSSVDVATELLIQDALRRLLRGRTSLVIAHRLSTIQSASRILVMHKGRIRETGTHQELLALGGIYHKLYLLQYQQQEHPVAAG